MLFKTALKNVKLNFRSYSIYFITISIAVALNYIFNLLPYQSFMTTFTTETKEELSVLLSTMQIPFAIASAGLAIYSNNFLIKRRSRELGIYLMLGIKYSKIYLLMIVETLILSSFAFVAGCLLGVLSVRFFDMSIISLLKLPMEQSGVLFNMEAFISTVIVFVVIYILIAILNFFVVSETSILKLVNAKGKSIKSINNKVALGIFLPLFIGSIVAIVYMYSVLSQPIKVLVGPETLLAFAVGFTGHVLFFISGAKVLAVIISSFKKLTYKDINLFTYKQISNKAIKTGGVLSIISFVMALAFTMLSMGASANLWVDETTKISAPYSVSSGGIAPNSPLEEVESYLKEKGYKIEDSHDFEVRKSDLSINVFFKEEDRKLLKDDQQFIFDETVLNNLTNIVYLDDYNKLREMAGFDKVVLKENSVALYVNTEFLKAFTLPKTVELNGKVYAVQEVLSEEVSGNGYILGNDVTLISNTIDKSFNEFTTNSFAINTNDLENPNLEKNLFNEINEVIMESENSGGVLSIQANVHESNLKQATGFIFTGLFIGIICLLISAAVLCLQQMTEITENKKGYDTIKKLGAKQNKINASIFKQILLYFISPLVVALIHSVFFTTAFSSYTHMILSQSLMLPTILITSVTVTVIYFIYIIFTYLGAKKYINDGKNL